MTNAIHGEHCGNDGSEAGLYLTIDARRVPEAGGWCSQLTEDGGGRELDCTACDHATPVDELAFDYGIIIADPPRPAPVWPELERGKA